MYLDTDMECLRPIDAAAYRGPLLLLGGEAGGVINISIFGATPGHALLDQVVAALPVSCLVNRDLV